MSKKEMLQAIRVCARRLGRNPNMRELRALAGIPIKTLYKQLGGMREALEAAGLETSGGGFKQGESVLLLDWAGVARRRKRLPSVYEYQRAGRFSYKPFQSRYGSWAAVPGAFQKFARKVRVEGKWRDVLRMIAATPVARPAADKEESGKERSRRGRRGGLLVDRPVYGSPLLLPEMAHAPTNESGVIFLFGALARKLGLVVLRMQTGYPDCEAMREMTPGKWQRLWIEFEAESRNFPKHKHRREGCDAIVCWKHNWKECPQGLEVIELRKVVGEPHH